MVLLRNARKLKVRQSRANPWLPTSPPKAPGTQNRAMTQTSRCRPCMQCLPGPRRFCLEAPAAESTASDSCFSPAEPQQQQQHTLPRAPLPAARRVFSQESWKVWDFFSPPSHCWDLREGRHYFCIMQELFIPTELEVWPEVRCKMSYFKLEAFPSENHPLWKEKNHVLIKKNPKTSTRRNPLIPRYKRPTGEERHLKQ